MEWVDPGGRDQFSDADLKQIANIYNDPDENSIETVSNVSAQRHSKSSGKVIWTNPSDMKDKNILVNWGKVLSNGKLGRIRGQKIFKNSENQCLI